MGEPIRGLYTIADNSLTPHLSLAGLAERFLQGGAKIVQLRAKGKEPPYEAARAILALKQRYSFLFIVNDFLELAREIGADGYHGGQDDPPPEAARRILGSGKVIGYSAHSLAEAVEAEKRGVDYVAFGAIFPTSTKGPDHPVQGIARLKEVCSTVKIPVVAIGGINRSNVRQVIDSGASAVAMISALMQADDIVREVAWYVEKFQQGVGGEGDWLSEGSSSVGA